MSHERNIEKIDRNLKFYSLSKWILGAAIAAAIIMVAVVQFVTLSSVQETTDQIQSCIDPQGTCYKSGDRRSGAVVKTLNETQKTIVIAAAFCAKQPGNDTVAEIEACVNKELAK